MSDGRRAPAPTRARRPGIALPRGVRFGERRPASSAEKDRPPDREIRRPADGPADGLFLAVFVPVTEIAWLRVLKPGFRHCFVALRRDGAWLALDALKSGIEVRALPVRPDFPLGVFYAGRGFRVLQGRLPGTRGAARLGIMPLTCVEVVKRAVGLRAARVVTPWQLYRRLRVAGAVEITAGGASRARVDGPGC